jgi:MFS family permease
MLNLNVNILKRLAFVSNDGNKTQAIGWSYLSKDLLFRIYRIATSVYFFVAGLTFATWASRIPDIQNKLHLSEAGLGGVLFALPVGLMISLPISGWLVSRFGSRISVITGALLYPLTLLLLAGAGSTLQLTTGLFLFGLFSNLVNIAMNTQAVNVEKLYGRSIMASFHGLWSLAGFTGAVTGTFFVSAGFSPFLHFSIVCGVTGLLVLVSYKFTLPHDIGGSGPQTIICKTRQPDFTIGIDCFLLHVV